VKITSRNYTHCKVKTEYLLEVSPSVSSKLGGLELGSGSQAKITVPVFGAVCTENTPLPENPRRPEGRLLFVPRKERK